MSDTMIAMDLIHADDLTPDQLMLGDLIKIGDDIVEVIFIESDSTGDNYDIQTENEFGETDFTQYSYTDKIPLYVFIEEEEQLKVFLCASPHKNARPDFVRLITFKKLTFLPPVCQDQYMKKTPEELRRLMELRRSNAASAVPSKKAYSRKGRKCQSELLQLKKYKGDPL